MDENNKIIITKEKYDINSKLYFFLKNVVKINLSDSKKLKLLEHLNLYSQTSFESKLLALDEFIEENFNKESQKFTNILLLTSEIGSDVDFKLFEFAIKLHSIKNLLLEEAKTKNMLDLSKLNELSPLTLKYDKITTYSPYSTRVNGALLSLIFFQKLESTEPFFFSNYPEEYLKSLSQQAIALKNLGVEPNQIFMLMFNESINQSIISDSGSNFEDRIKSVLINIGIPESEIKKIHDKNDSSTEFDFFFEINGKTCGVGAKRTLRERYKQFIKTAQMSQLDIMIEITLGTDIRPNIAKSIVSHNVILFVADEIYDSKEYLRQLKGIYPSRDFNLETLTNLSIQ